MAFNPDEIETLNDVVGAVEQIAALLDEWREHSEFRGFEVKPFEALRAAMEQADKLAKALPCTLLLCADSEDDDPAFVKVGDEIALAYTDHQRLLQCGRGKILEVRPGAIEEETVLRVELMDAIGGFCKGKLCWAGWDAENDHWIPCDELEDITG